MPDREYKFVTHPAISNELKERGLIQTNEQGDFLDRLSAVLGNNPYNVGKEITDRDSLFKGKRHFVYNDEKYGLCDIAFKVERSHVVISYVALKKN